VVQRVLAGSSPECIPNRVLATSSQPVSSTNWKQMIRDTMALAEYQSGNAAAALSVVQTSSDSAPKTQAPAVAQALTSAPTSRSVQMPHDRTAASAPSFAQATQPTAAANVSTAGQSVAPLTTDHLSFIVNEAIAAVTGRFKTSHREALQNQVSLRQACSRPRKSRESAGQSDGGDRERISYECAGPGLPRHLANSA